MAAATTARPSWPAAPAEREQPTAHDLIAEMAQLLRDTRANLLAGGGVLSAVTVGFALEAASARPLRPGPAGVINGVLLCALLVCWLRAVTLLALAGRPVLSQLSELRWATGAPLDPRPGWPPLPPTGAGAEGWSWIRAERLVGAARLSRDRAHLADTWTYLTAAGFLLWTVVVVLGR